MSTVPFHPLANVFPLMAGAEYAALVADIRDHGLREPIIVLDGQVLDGRNRMRACVDSGVPYRLEPFDGADPVAFVVSMNLRRRHLDESQRSVCAARIENLRHGERADLTTERDANLHLLPDDTHRPAPVTRSTAAKLLNVSERSVANASAVLDKGTPELIEKVDRGEVSVSAAADVAQLPQPEQREIVARGEREIIQAAQRIRAEKSAAGKRERAERIAVAAASVPAASERYRLIHGSVLELMHEPENSVDLICTDPPYPKEFLPVYADLARVSLHLLKPGGLLVCMSGQSWLPEVMARLGDGLSYQWTIAYLTPGGQATQIFPRKVNTFWKPVFVFCKGEYHGDWFGDVARSDVNDNDKDHHHWGQSESGMRDLMRRFVRPGHVVVDPFLGGGTTAIVALALGATFIGSDIDKQAINTTKARLADAKLVA